MSYVGYKRFGNKLYGYEVTSYWDSKKKIPRQKGRYLGVVDEERGIIERRKQRGEKLILDFGDSFTPYEFIKKIKLIDIN